MINEARLCKNCGKQIDPSRRKDSLFCNTQHRQAYWELSGKRKAKSVDNDVHNGLGLNTPSLIGNSELKASENLIKKSGDINGNKTTNKTIL